MKRRLSSWWYELHDALWFIPALMTIAAMVLAFATIELDQRVLAGHELKTWWVFDGGAEGARGVLTTIAGTMIAIAATAYSVTIVAIQLGSSQYTPRILREFTGDHGNQFVLGAFVSTFAYSVIVLRSVHSASSDLEVFVPTTAVTVAIALALASVASLIYFFHHAARTIQAPVVIERAAQDTFSLIDRAYVQRDRFVPAPDDIGLPVSRQITATAPSSGYVLSIDEDALFQLATNYEAVVEVWVRVGDHLFTATPIATITIVESGADANQMDEHDTCQRIHHAFRIGIERTHQQDVLLGFRQLADIALKALSPGVNDPTTAVLCIDRMGEALIRARHLRSGKLARSDEANHPRLVVEQPGFEQFANEAFRQIRHYGAGDATVVIHALRVLEAIGKTVSADMRVVLCHEARTIVEEASQAVRTREDVARIEKAARWAT